MVVFALLKFTATRIMLALVNYVRWNTISDWINAGRYWKMLLVNLKPNLIYLAKRIENYETKAHQIHFPLQQNSINV